MKIIITGGKGYIGSRLARAFSHPDNNILTWTRQGLFNKNEALNFSLLEENDVMNALHKIQPDLIIHCAGAPDVWKSLSYPSQDLEGNYLTTHNLLYSMQKLHLEKCRFVYLSSAAVYGNPTHLPISEEDDVNPLTPYALHKHFSELLCYYMSRNYNLDTKVARIFSAFGPGIKKQIFWDMYKKLMENNEIILFGDGSDSRDYIYIDDVVNAIKLIADKAPCEEVFYNVANGIEITIRSVAKIFCEKYGVSSDVLKFSGKARAGDPANWLADITKLKSLGYRSAVTFEDGVGFYAQWCHDLSSADKL